MYESIRFFLTLKNEMNIRVKLPLPRTCRCKRGNLPSPAEDVSTTLFVTTGWTQQSALSAITAEQEVESMTAASRIYQLDGQRSRLGTASCSYLYVNDHVNSQKYEVIGLSISAAHSLVGKDPREPAMPTSTDCINWIVLLHYIIPCTHPVFLFVCLF